MLDIGSHAARFGYAGDDCPKAIFPSVSTPSRHGCSRFANLTHLLRRTQTVGVRQGTVDDSKDGDATMTDGSRPASSPSYPFVYLPLTMMW